MADQQITINTATMQECGDNVKATMQDKLLVVIIDTTQEIGPSASGKMMGYGSTSGFTSLPGNLKGNIYIGRKI